MLFRSSAPALLLAAISATGAKLLWRSQLRDRTWTRLCVGAAVANLVVCLAGLIVTGHDGRMVTYAGMVFACTASMWWSTRRR